MGRSEHGPRSWPDNLEAQNVIVAAILRHLLNGGITRADLSVDQFRPIRAAGYPEPADFEGLFLDIMVWLSDEGIIAIGQIADDGRGGNFFTDCVITALGMNLLRRKADVLGGATAADVIMSTKERDASASQLVKLGGLIGGVLGGFTRAAG
jgi:hypothetical protein